MTPELKTVNNNPNASYWNLENGYKNGIAEESYPKRIFNTKQDAGLLVFLQLSTENFEYLCTGPIQVRIKALFPRQPI